MSEEWRFLLTDANTAAKNMAIDRAVLVANSNGKVPPTVRFLSMESSCYKYWLFPES